MKPLPTTAWDPSLHRIIDDMDGRPLNVHALMANHPELLEAWWDYRNYSVRGGALPERDRELVILRVAVHMRAWYEWGSHVDRGLAAGLTMDEINRVLNGQLAGEWTSSEALLLEAVDQLVKHQGIAVATQSSLAAHYSAQQIMDVISIHGMYVTLACMINTFGLELDEHISARLPEAATRESFERSVSATNRD